MVMRRRLGLEVFDVIVLGGGLSGYAAAIDLATSKLNTLLVERRPVLGWESTWALDLDWSGAEGAVNRGALGRAMSAAGGLREDLLDGPILEMVLDRELLRVGGEVLHNAYPVSVGLQGDVMSEVVVASRGGELALRSRTFVDATENALIWRLAGETVELRAPRGRSRFYINGLNGPSQPESIGSIGGVDSVIVGQSVWPEEVSISYELESTDPLEPLRRLPILLTELSSFLPGMENAVVTHHSVEPLPLGPTARANVAPGGVAPHVANLFAAANWSDHSPQASDFAARLRRGQDVASAVAQRVDEFIAEAGATSARVTPPEASVVDSEVLVCGGGTGGAIAALAARREGAQVTIVEASPLIGGIAIGGGLHLYYHGFPGGLQDVVDRRVRALSRPFGPSGRVRGFHPIAKRAALAQLLGEADVSIVLDTVVTNALVSESGSTGDRTRVSGVGTCGPNGAGRYQSSAIVDSTGDGDVAHLAGARSTFGREKDHLPHAFSLGAGRIDEDRQILLHMTNFDAGYCDPSDPQDLTRARRQALEHMWQDRFTPKTRKTYIAPLLGVRSSRQIVGDQTIEMRDLVAGREYEDAIAYARAHLDNHADDLENESDEAMVWTWLLGFHWRLIGVEIPYRALLPADLDGLIMGCRAISLSHDAHTTVRMQRDVQRVGEAAGIAAALSAEAHVSLREVPIDVLQERLLASGALGSKSGDDQDGSIHRPDRIPPSFPERSILDWIADLDTESAPDAVWPLYEMGPRAISQLLPVVEDESSERAFWGSVVLALNGNAAGAPALIRAVVERRGARAESVKAVPAWHAAVVLLGRTHNVDAGPVLTDLIENEDVEHDVLVAAIRSVGQIEYQAARQSIEALIGRDELPSQRMLQVSHVRLRDQGHNRAPGVIEDARYAVDLTAAEALARLGYPRDDIVSRYLNDNRAYVRRFAMEVESQQARNE